MEFTIQLIVAAIAMGTPLLIATLGGILSERAGVIQLGAEGFMIMGAVISCITYLQSGSFLLAMLAVIVVTAVLGLLHAYISVSLGANQVVSGIAITLFGSGLSAYLGKPYSNVSLSGAVPTIRLPWLDQVPLLGDLFSKLPIFTWFSFLLVIALHLLIHHTSWGLHLRAVGNSPETVDVMGVNVILLRYAYVIAGSSLLGLAGANLLLVNSPSWLDNMTAGRGWIAVALVIFARWNPFRALLCAYLFGALESFGLRIQLITDSIPSFFLKMLPYIITILVLMFIGWRNRNKPSGAPEALGQPYFREQRL